MWKTIAGYMVFLMQLIQNATFNQTRDRTLRTLQRSV